QTGPDRPDISNPAAPLNTRAVTKASCATGFGNPDAPGTLCIDPTTVHFIQGTGNPNANTLGRNALRAPGYSNLDAGIAKHFKFGERRDLMFRAEMFNAFNETNFSNRVAPRTVKGSPSGQFLDFTQTESYGRTMRMRLSFYF
ncbi:MAG TPA: hypothetical protein VEU31_09150, partial [Candidatus Acidoferrales bacterium]|nr:hypothetical protein [Candidatus Acidoferrales bacterium]